MAKRMPATEQCGGENENLALVCGSRHCLQSWLQRVVFFLPHGLSDTFTQNMLLCAPLLAPWHWLVCPPDSAVITARSGVLCQGGPGVPPPCFLKQHENIRWDRQLVYLVLCLASENGSKSNFVASLLQQAFCNEERSSEHCCSITSLLSEVSSASLDSMYCFNFLRLQG